MTTETEVPVFTGEDIENVSKAMGLTPWVKSPADFTLIDGGNPDELYPVPDETSFRSKTWQEDKHLNAVRSALVSARFPEIGDWRIGIVWKLTGGTSAGANVLGKATILGPANILRHHSNWDAYIWLAADHMRDGAFSRYQVEAVIDHELRHFMVETPDEGPDKLVMVAHDFEEFHGTIREYGLYMGPRMEATRDVWVQAKFAADRMPDTE